MAQVLHPRKRHVWSWARGSFLLIVQVSSTINLYCMGSLLTCEQCVGTAQNGVAAGGVLLPSACYTLLLQPLRRFGANLVTFR